MHESTHSDCLISVVIPAYHSADTIGATLQAVSRQSIPYPYEIIVVNSSNDATPALIRDQFPGVTLVQLERQTSAGEARNLGAKQARGRYLAFVDSDCIVDERWLELMLSHYSAVFCGIGGPIENANPDSLVSCAGHILEFSEFYTRKGIIPTDHIPSGNLFLAKSLFDRSGGFPTNLFPQEDRYYSWKLRRDTGKTFLFHSAIVVKHAHRESLLRFLRHQVIIGRAGAEILKHTDLRGSGIIHKRWLVNVILPILPMIKLTRAMARTVCKKPKEIASYPQIIVLLCIGMFCWMVGFGAQANKK